MVEWEDDGTYKCCIMDEGRCSMALLEVLELELRELEPEELGWFEPP